MATTTSNSKNRSSRDLQREGAQAEKYAHKNGWNAGLAVPTLGGIALAVFGIARRSWMGVALASAGGFLAYRGFQHRREGPVHVEASFTINKSKEEVFRFIRDENNLRQIFSGLQSSRSIGPQATAWNFSGPFGSFDFSTETIEEREGNYIAWRSLPNSVFEHRGSIELRTAPGNRGSEITMALQYQPPVGAKTLVRPVLLALGAHPEQIIREGLRRLKQLMEAGEIPTTKGQPVGQRGARGRALELLYREKRQPVGTGKSAEQQPRMAGD